MASALEDLSNAAPPSFSLPAPPATKRFRIPAPRAPLSLAEKNGRATLERRWSDLKVLPAVRESRVRRSWPETEREEKQRLEAEGTRKTLARKLAQTALEAEESGLDEEEEEEGDKEGRELMAAFTVITPSPRKKVRRVSGATPLIAPLSFASAPDPPPVTTVVRGAKAAKARRKPSPSPPPPPPPTALPPSTHQTAVTTLLAHSHLLPAGWLTVLEALIAEGESALAGTTKGASKVAARLALGESAAVLGEMRGDVRGNEVGRGKEGMPPESFRKKGKGEERRVPLKQCPAFVGELRWIHEGPGRER